MAGCYDAYLHDIQVVALRCMQKDKGVKSFTIASSAGAMQSIQYHQAVINVKQLALVTESLVVHGNIVLDKFDFLCALPFPES